MEQKTARIILKHAVIKRGLFKNQYGFDIYLNSGMVNLLVESKVTEEDARKKASDLMFAIELCGGSVQIERGIFL